MACDVVSVLLLLLSFPLSPTRGTECNEGDVEWQGQCEECETAVLAGWEVKDSCPQCPDVTKRGLHCNVNCRETCAEGCERWTRRCHGCKKDSVTGHGRCGDRCEDGCPQNCKNGVCNQTYGDCQDGCEDGFFGDYCNQLCPSTCLCEIRKYCTHTPCIMGGNCTYGFKHGYYGGDCSTPCPPGCTSNSCTREGKYYVCRHRSYGDQCQLPCSDHCTLKQCHQDTGVCSHGCEPGFWGNTSLSVCPDSCVNCTSLTDCFLCKDGWYGTACQHRCRGHCRGGCDDSGECKQCKDGFYVVDCNKACSQHCVSLTDGPGACTRSSGHCLHGCKNGYFGPRCDAECSDHCVDRTCEGQFPEYGGACVKGCKDGYRGVYCQVPCPDHCQTCSQRHVGCGQCQDGWYGSVCQERCQDCSGPCHQDTGNCSVAVTTPAGAKVSAWQATLIFSVLFLAVGVLVVVTVVLSAWHCYRERQSQKEIRNRDGVIDDLECSVYKSPYTTDRKDSTSLTGE